MNKYSVITRGYFNLTSVKADTMITMIEADYYDINTEGFLTLYKIQIDRGPKYQKVASFNKGDWVSVIKQESNE